jgi:hypothetical protein
MSSPADERFPKPEPGIDAVVRAQLDAEAATVDGGAVWDRIRARLEVDATPVRPAPAFAKGGGVRGVTLTAVGLAAAFLVAVFVIPPRAATASPAEAVEKAKAAHARGADRCYAQTAVLPPNASPALVAEVSRPVTLCTQGDRFVVEPGFGGKGAWGRDAAGRVWVAPTRDAAARFDEAELPATLREEIKIRGLEVEPLLDEVLKEFDLEWSSPPARGAPTMTVVATRRGLVGRFQLIRAELVIETETNLLRSLVLERHIPAGVAKVTLALSGSAERDPAAYTAEGHINTGRPVYDAARPVLRRALMIEHVKEVFANAP